MQRLNAQKVQNVLPVVGVPCNRPEHLASQPLHLHIVWVLAHGGQNKLDRRHLLGCCLVHPAASRVAECTAPPSLQVNVTLVQPHRSPHHIDAHGLLRRVLDGPLAASTADRQVEPRPATPTLHLDVLRVFEHCRLNQTHATSTFEHTASFLVQSKLPDNRTSPALHVGILRMPLHRASNCFWTVQLEDLPAVAVRSRQVSQRFAR
mmetsp:Transcript_4705/g.13136  ORF Transcript_4705/g.13136 Transcript_4705/m.13136 type:complete len:206 (+) Transcript_4705:1045-1662(+)